MFTELHAMAKAAMLLITATAEGDQLRVSVSPTYPDGKAPAGAVALRPLSLVGTPEELDADFGAALALWLTPPKRSIMEQAQAAAGQDADEAPAAKVATKTSSKPAETKAKRNAGRKTSPAAQSQDDAETKSDDEDQDDDAETGAPTATPVAEAPAAVDPAPVTTAPAPVVDVVDAQTLDLF